jgi:hypothetical protein
MIIFSSNNISESSNSIGKWDEFTYKSVWGKMREEKEKKKEKMRYTFLSSKDFSDLERLR